MAKLRNIKNVEKYHFLKRKFEQCTTVSKHHNQFDTNNLQNLLMEYEEQQNRLFTSLWQKISKEYQLNNFGHQRNNSK